MFWVHKIVHTLTMFQDHLLHFSKMPLLDGHGSGLPTFDAQDGDIKAGWKQKGVLLDHL